MLFTLCAPPTSILPLRVALWPCYSIKPHSLLDCNQIPKYNWSFLLLWNKTCAVCISAVYHTILLCSLWLFYALKIKYSFLLSVFFFIKRWCIWLLFVWCHCFVCAFLLNVFALDALVCSVYFWFSGFCMSVSTVVYYSTTQQVFKWFEGKKG